jgi:hypothetical protein
MKASRSINAGGNEMPRFEPLNDGERAWVADNIAQACTFAKKYGGDPETVDRASLAALDRVWSLFTSNLRETGGDPNGVINMIGLAFGHHLATTCELSWVVATDEQGSEIALYGQLGEILIYPTNFVAKRWIAGEGAFMERVFEQIQADVTRLRSGR